MGGAVSTPKGGHQHIEQPEYYLEEFVGPKAYNLGSPFWGNLLSVPLNYPWAEDRVNAACAWLARNNRFTGHIVKLLIHVVWSLQEERTTSSGYGSNGGIPAKAINAVHFSRIFLKYFIEVFNADVVDHLQLSDIDGEFAELQKSDQNVIELVLRSLLTFVGSADMNSRTYLLHLEVVNLLLVMMSTQLHPGYIGAPRILHPFLETAMLQEMELVGPFVRKLVISFMARLPVPSGSSFSLSSSSAALSLDGNGSNTAKLLRRMTSAAASVFLLPYYSYAYLVNAQGEVSKSPLADNSLLLLLVLVHNIKMTTPTDNTGSDDAIGGEKQHQQQLVGMNGGVNVETLYPPKGGVAIPPGFNPFREALETLHDTNFYPILKNVSNANAVDDGDLELDAQRTSSSWKVPYGVLYERLGVSIADERSTLLLYSLVHGNAAFLEYVFVRVDLDTLLLPLLEVLYNASRCNSNQIYMLLIILLILSQDSSFNASIHKLMLPAGVPWYKERLLPRTSLGSLMVVILIRIVKENLSKLRDVYLHTNCLATLANMAPHCHQLNAYASQCLVTLFDMLARKYTRLSETHTNGVSVHISDSTTNVAQLTEQSNAPQPQPEEVPTELHIYTDFLRIVLEIINSILTYALPRNPEVVYALLHRQELFQPYREHPNFQELLANIYTVVEFFSIPLNSEHIDGYWSVERVLQVIIDNMRSWRGEGMKTFTQLRFTYEEEVHSEDFFTPYVWQLVVAHSGITWDLDLNPSSDPAAVLCNNNDNENNSSKGELSPLPAIVDPSTPTILQHSRSIQQ